MAALWPPVEAGLTADRFAVFGEGDASFGDDGIEVGKPVEVPVGDRLVDVGPQGFCRLEFRRLGRQVDEPDALGNGERRGVPTGTVEDEKDDPLASGAGLAGEECQGIADGSKFDYQICAASA